MKLNLMKILFNILKLIPMNAWLQLALSPFDHVKYLHPSISTATNIQENISMKPDCEWLPLHLVFTLKLLLNECSQNSEYD